MVAQAQRLTVALLLALSLAWGIALTLRGAWAAGLLGAILIANLQTFVLAVEFFVLLPLANRTDTVRPRPTWLQLIRAWGCEVVTAHAVFGWHQPFRSRRHSDTIDGPGVHGRRAVVLVHGYLCNRGLWNRWMPRLKAAGIPCVAVTMEPAFASIDDYVGTLDEAITRTTLATGRPPLVVGHSMGGLAIRAWWRAAGLAGDGRIDSVITIASPHHGAVPARVARGVNARQMRRHSDWLTALERSERTEQRARFTCFFSDCDNIALPASTGMLVGADNRHVLHRPHVALAYAPEVLDEVLRRLKPTPT
jgi:pimeloyl-ACP methyl ester carboxylesterase